MPEIVVTIVIFIPTLVMSLKCLAEAWQVPKGPYSLADFGMIGTRVCLKQPILTPILILNILILLWVWSTDWPTGGPLPGNWNLLGFWVTAELHIFYISLLIPIASRFQSLADSSCQLGISERPSGQMAKVFYPSN